MTVVSIEKDVEALTMRFVAEFDAGIDRVWQLWKDPRQLERWWGPPTYPATFEKHDFRVGGRSAYYMTGPDGEKPRGWWQITAIEEPTRFEFDDGFAIPHAYAAGGVRHDPCGVGAAAEARRDGRRRQAAGQGLQPEVIQ